MALTKEQEKTIKLLNDSNPGPDLRNQIYDFIFLSLNNAPPIIENDWTTNPFHTWFYALHPTYRKFGLNCLEYKNYRGKKFVCDYERWKITYDGREHDFNDLQLEECGGCGSHISFNKNFLRIRKEWKGIRIYYRGETRYILQNIDNNSVVEICNDLTKEVKKWNPSKPYDSQEWKIVKHVRGFEII